MNSGEFARTWLFLIRMSRKEIIVNAFCCQKLGIIEIPNHTVVLEILKEKSQPPCGVSPHPKVDNPIMDFRVDLDLIALWLVGDRLTRTPSAIVRNFIFDSADMDDPIAGSSPFPFLNLAVNFRRLPVTNDEIGIELKVG